MSKVKVQLRVPTVGKKVGDVIEVENQDAADQLIGNGTARPVESPKAGKSDKD